MKYLAILFFLFSASFAGAEDGTRIKALSADINNRIQGFQNYSELTNDEKKSIRLELVFLKDILDDLGIESDDSFVNTLTCAKQGNGRYYPVNIDSFEIVGSSDYSASYPSLNACKETLPDTKDALACAKSGNGRFYPADRSTLAIKGSAAYSASYPSHASCKETVPAIGVKVSCAKSDNGRFYPVKVATYEILGDSSYNASYPSFDACLKSL